MDEGSSDMSAGSSRDEALFALLRTKSADARPGFLDAMCEGDPALRTRLETMLAADIAPDEKATLDLPSDQSTRRLGPNVARDESVGQTLGRYKLLEKVGEGGFGVVYVAEQKVPIRRRVALKIIKLGMDTRSVVARFEAERQALAMMDHPNIAKVLDAGATPTGRPYFVMELVRGVPITEFCDQNKMAPVERMKLFILVCQAIQHAHQKGIIHRDIKPSNILVTLHDGIPVPKVIDFGIAKATRGELTEKTVYTQFQQFIGTPAYMSPEQAEMSGLDIDTRSDIYSLGVLLYELLTGLTPFDAADLMKAGMDEMRRRIRQTEPIRPSNRLSGMTVADSTETARRRGMDTRRLIALLRGDIDWIVIKCLEKDRARRYETANSLAGDIQRHLNNEPITARPPSTTYRLQKMMRRNKLVFGATVAVALALLFGILASTWQAVRATRAQREAIAAQQQADAARNIEATLRVQAEADDKKAQTEAARSAVVARFMEDMLEGVGPSVALGRDTTLLSEILDKTAKQLDDLTDQPDVEAELRNTIGEVYLALGDSAKAEAMQRAALALQVKSLGSDNLDVATTKYDLARALLERNNPESESLHRDALAIRRRLLGNQSPVVADSLDNLARTLRSEGKFAEAESMQREALAIRKQLYGEESAEVGTSLHNLANLLGDQNKLAESESMHREALAIRRKLYGDEQPDVASSLYDLGRVLREEGKLDESESVQRKSLAIRRKVLGNEHRRVGDSLEELSRTLLQEGKFPEAESDARESLSLWEKRYAGTYSLFVGQSLLGGCLLDQKKYADAEPLLLSGYQGLKSREATMPAQNRPRFKESLDWLVQLYQETGRPDQATAILKAAGEDPAVNP
jgi:serine/threonine protein kinase/tetratricopeptide (TPR) repeat protein